MFVRFTIGFVVLVLSAGELAASNACHYLGDSKISSIGAEITRPQFEPEPPTDGESSFRGLSLGMGRDEVASVLQRLNLEEGVVSGNATDICRGEISIGTLRFDQNNRVIKLELSPYYFVVGRVDLREFADEVFKHYQVRPLEVDDDACFYDVTCFRGTTNAREQFLILRMGGAVLLHVWQRLPPERDRASN
jgi:hypothetical protein